MPRKIVITGPESTGKSTLAKALADYFKASIVSEYAREYLDQLGRAYQEEDLLKIAQGQVNLEDQIFEASSAMMVIDTDLTVIHIWSEEKFGQTHPWILNEMQKRAYDLYLVPDIDLEWIFDPQRENPYDRDRLMKLYLQLFEERKVKYHVVNGKGEERVQHAIEIIKKELNV